MIAPTSKDTDVRFSEPLFCYHFDSNGMHTGRSLPQATQARLLNYLSIWVPKSSEVRVTDIFDHLVMHIINQKVVFPPREDGVKVLWDPNTSNFTQEVPTDQRTAVARFYSCVKCSKPFTAQNVFTRAGWRETQITGYCEKCFDNIFAGDED